VQHYCTVMQTKIVAISHVSCEWLMAQLFEGSFGSCVTKSDLLSVLLLGVKANFDLPQLLTDRHLRNIKLGCEVYVGMIRDQKIDIISVFITRNIAN